MNEVANELNTIKDFVLSVLKECREARNSDTVLYLKCCKGEDI